VLVGEAVRTSGERAGTDLGDVGEATAGHRGTPTRIGVHDLLGTGEVLVQDRELPLDQRVDDTPRHDLAIGDRDHDVGELTGDDVHEKGPKPALATLAGPVCENLVLGLLFEAEVAESRCCGQHAGLDEDLASGQKLLVAHRVERMWLDDGRRLGPGGDVGHGRTPR
jgi:hypothetical protein